MSEKIYRVLVSYDPNSGRKTRVCSNAETNPEYKIHKSPCGQHEFVTYQDHLYYVIYSGANTNARRFYEVLNYAYFCANVKNTSPKVMEENK